jgi:lactoylglutathione lyase
VFAHDLEKSRTFYRDFLGFKERASSRGALFDVNGGQYVELLPEDAPATDRLSHIALETANLEEARRYFAGRGLTPTGSGASFTIRDPEGHVIEFVESKARAAESQAGQVSKRIMHVGIIVTQFDPEMAFYQQVLGFREFWRGAGAGRTELSWVNLKVPDGEDYIELMLYKVAPEATRRGSAHHLCLEVPDAAAAIAALDSKPYRKQYTQQIEARTGVNRRRQVNLFDPDGTRSELMEPVTVDGKPAASSTLPPPK